MRVMNASPLTFVVSGPAIAAQNCGFDVQLAPPAGATMTLASTGRGCWRCRCWRLVPRLSAPLGSLP